MVIFNKYDQFKSKTIIIQNLLKFNHYSIVQDKNGVYDEAMTRTSSYHDQIRKIMSYSGLLPTLACLVPDGL